MSLQIREFSMDDYEEAYLLWEATPGMGLSDADSPVNIRSYLDRNPGLSFVAASNGSKLAGTILAGHDGRRGFIYHLAVRPEARGNGIGEALVKAALDGLLRQGIAKCHILVLADNVIGQRFWAKAGWQQRDNLLIYSMDTARSGKPSSSPC
jgi:N-acetylglutamate synthase